MCALKYIVLYYNYHAPTKSDGYSAGVFHVCVRVSIRLESYLSAYWSDLMK